MFSEIRRKYKNLEDSMIEMKPSSEADQMKKICWIFDEKATYQVLISFCSIIKNNPNETFAFYFIIPPTFSMDTTNFEHFLRHGSKIYIRHYHPKHTYMPMYSNLTCRWSGIIIAKLYLFEILPEADKILYLDTDVMNAAPIDKLWLLPLSGKTIAAPERIHYSNRWINSGVVFYNLDVIRRQPSELWKCANRKTCFVDDAWHTYCHKKSLVSVISYRYNVEFGSVNKRFEHLLHVKEERNAVFYHLKDVSQEFYRIKKRSDIKCMEIVRGIKDIIIALDKLFDIKEWVDSEIQNMTKKK